MSVERSPEHCLSNAEIRREEDENGKWVPVREAAEITGYAESTIRNLAREGKIALEKRRVPVIRNYVCVSIKDLLRYKKEVRMGRPPKK